MSPQSSDSPLPQHVEETVHAVEQLHTQHHQSATPSERILDQVKDNLSRPVFFGLLVMIIVLWIAANAIGPKLYRIDPSPFIFLQLAFGMAAVLLTILILATQRRADRLAAHREKLILQLAFVSERKIAKVISLIEELRRDLPQAPNRYDAEAEQMVTSVNAAAVADALRDEALPALAEALKE